MTQTYSAKEFHEQALKKSVLVSGSYKLSVGAFFAFIGLTFLTIVEMRRAIFLPAAEYTKIGSPSTILYVSVLHIPLLITGIVGAALSYRYMTRWEKNLGASQVQLMRQTKVFALALLAFLMADLLTYRIVPASRIAAAGKLGIGEAIPLASFPSWLQPLASGINYLALVWHATVVGLLLGALFLTIAASFLVSRLRGEGFRSHVTGAALAVPQPFCSCCAAPVGCSLYRGGVSLGPTLAFTVSSPMLNVTSLILATILLPPSFAALRVLGGVFVGVFLTYTVSRLASGWTTEQRNGEKPSRITEFSSRLVNAYSKLFRFETFLEGKTIDSPGTLISAWFGMAWRLGKVMVPVLFVGAVVTSAIVMNLPSPGNDFVGVLIAAALGTMLMIPTWTEIPIAQGLISAGITGPAAALLITLPAVSIPCLAILSGGVGNSRVPLLLGLLVFIFGSIVGLVFLAGIV